MTGIENAPQTVIGVLASQVCIAFVDQKYWPVAFRQPESDRFTQAVGLQGAAGGLSPSRARAE